MAFPASNGSIPLTLEAAWSGARSAAAQIQAQCAMLQSQITAGTISSQAVVNVTSILAGINVQLTQFAAVPGLAAYAQAQVNNPGLDVAGSFSAMQSALVAVVTWVVGNFPKDSASYLQAIKFNASGLLVWDNFTASQLAGLATLLTALSATIV